MVPSRYCPSDRLAPTALAIFGGDPGDLPGRVSAWVAGTLAYQAGASGPLTGADKTLLARAGVCRDFAHLTVALLRALQVPARYVSAYAPGVDPPDFHALTEAHDGAGWRLHDATGKTDQRRPADGRPGGLGPRPAGSGAAPGAAAAPG